MLISPDHKWQGYCTNQNRYLFEEKRTKENLWLGSFFFLWYPDCCDWICKFKGILWCDQAKWVWRWSNSIFIFLIQCIPHLQSYFLKQTPLKFVNWFQRYRQLKRCKNKWKQRTCLLCLVLYLKTVFVSRDWFCLITPHIKGVFGDSSNFFLWYKFIDIKNISLCLQIIHVYV